MNVRLLLLPSACSVLLLLLCVETKDVVDVVIIGAGVSGLSAGRYLLQSKKQKYNVTILEARNRTGGRVWTNLNAFPGAVGGEVDCGASWIHGGDKGNPVRDFAERSGIETIETDYDDVTIKRNGTKIPNRELDAKDKEYSKMMKDAEKSNLRNVSVRAALEKLGYGDRLKDPVIGLFIAGDEGENGASINRVSNGDDNYTVFPGNDRVFPRGYSQIPQSLQRGRELEQPLRVLYNETVKRVVSANDSVTVYTQTSQYQADRVIATLPLGVLKNGDVVFDPPLSASKQEAIGKIGFGLLGKVLLKFSSVFWDKETPFFEIVSEDVNQRGFLTFWVNGYYVSGVPSLIGFLTGDSAIDAENMTDDALRIEATNTVLMLFGSTSPRPVGFFRTAWQSDPYSRGSYSYSAVGSHPSHREALRQSEGLLHFAGEHTQGYFYSTVHGAYISGIIAAKEIETSTAQNPQPGSATQLPSSVSSPATRTQPSLLLPPYVLFLVLASLLI